MNGTEIRKSFLDYFASKGHMVIQSSSLVPHDDPTILFTNAGMNQFKGCFLGTEKRAYKRAASSQKCLRVSGKHNDFENVGVTARHHTFFEMLGNFSFGDYFKKEAIEFAWEYVTTVLKIPKSLLWATVYEKDDEAKDLWKNHTDIIPNRILKMSDKDNFWAMGDTGPCGPCSEIFVYVGDKPDQQSEEEFRKDDGTYLEIWNLVFMQYDRDAEGRLTPLPNPCIDTGMGLERAVSVLQKVAGNYETDLLNVVIKVCEERSGFKYKPGSYKISDLKEDLDYARNVAMRVIADHSRSAAFLIADGVLPSADGRGYVLRRILRRAIRHGRVLQFKEPFLAATTAEVVKKFEGQYPELKEASDTIMRVVDAEERKFYETLDAGLGILTKEVEKLGKDQSFPGETAFLLYDTYGFPLDLTEDALKAFNKVVDVKGYTTAMEAQRERSREDRKSQGIAFISKKIDGKPTEFVGYNTLSSEGSLVSILEDGKIFKKGDEVSLVFDKTPFYAESGGQVGDTGKIKLNDAELEVIDTKKAPTGHIVHISKILSGELQEKNIGSQASLSVNKDKRDRIAIHHSATHVMHASLKKVLGEHVKQAGSRVDENSLRFDYSHFEAPSSEQLKEIIFWANDYIRQNYEATTQIMSLSEAKKKGATALFGEKYGENVRVVTLGPSSMELCGGTHVSSSGNIGSLLLAGESGVSSGVRRIEVFAGPSAVSRVWNERSMLDSATSLLKCDLSSLPERIEKLMQKTKALEKDLEILSSKNLSLASGSYMENARTTSSGIKVIIQKVDGDAETLKGMVDQIRVKMGSGIVALGSTFGDSGIIVAGSTSDLSKKVNIGQLIKDLIKETGGRGGGRSDFAQAGGLDPVKVPSALDRFFNLIS